MAEKVLPPISETEFYGMIANSRVVLPLGYSSFVQNFYLDDGAWIPRPGMLLTAAFAEGVDDPVQGLYMFEELDGTRHFLGVSGGELYEYDFAMDSWSSIDTSSIDIDSNNKVRFANSRGRLIGTDGANKPWMGEYSGSWSFTELTDAPVADGVAIYYDKAFFFGIAGAENSFEWSNEGDPTLGYAAVDQVWEFAQTDFGAVVALAPLNELMDVLKKQSGSHLLGAVDEDFQTNAVREGLSETEGVVGIDAAIISDGDVYALSALGPRVAIGGQRWESLHHIDTGGKSVDILADVLSTLNAATLAGAIAFEDQDRALVGWLVPLDASGALNYAIIVNKVSRAWQVFSWDTAFNFTTAVSIKDDDENKRVAFGTDLGRVYIYGDAARLNDDTDKAIEYRLRSRMYGQSSPTILKRLSELSLMFNTTTAMDAELRPVRDGDVGDGRRFGRTVDLGRKTYRRGFNAVGVGCGWEFYMNALDMTVSIERATTILTAVGMQSNW